MTEVEILQRLIQIPSLSGKENELSGWIVNYMQKLDINPVREKWGVAVKIPGKDSKRGLIFNAHVDTVNPGKIEDWKYSPFGGEAIGGRLYGLGASDNKASAAVLIKIAEILTTQQPIEDVWLTWVVKEETTGEGTNGFLEWWMAHHNKRYHDVAAIISEPTGASWAANRHKGNIFVEIVTKGDSGHGARPDLIKTQAIEEMIKVKRHIWREFGGSMTNIHAGDSGSPNKFPNECRAIFDIRTGVQDHEKSIQRLMKLANCKFIFDPLPPGYTSRKNKVVKIIEEILGAEVGDFGGSSDLCSFSQAGIPGIILGPGNSEAMHQPDEYCDIGNLNKCRKIYLDLIERFGVE